MSCVKAAINVVADLVQKEMKTDEAFTFNRFFKDAKTKATIQAVVKTGKYKRAKGSARVKS